jgi:hypothetical protein
MSTERSAASTISRISPSGLPWKGLYRIGGVAALTCALMYLITLAVYVPANLASPPPGTVPQWFGVFLASPITGLFYLGLADAIILILWGPMSLALYFALRQASRTWTTIAVPFVFVGVSVFLATNTAFSMLFLSREFAAATSEAERSMLLAAGEALIATSQGTGGRYAGMPLTWFGGLMLSVVMLRSRDFTRATAWAGIVGLGLLVAGVPFGGHYTDTGASTAVQSAVVAAQYIGGGLLSLAWYILVGLGLLRISRS